jgi:hypothetical protein
MDLDGARIYDEGVGIDKSAEDKIRQIVTSIKTLSPASDVGMRFVKSGRVIEALLWGKAKDFPIGVYNRGPSLNAVLDTIQRKVKKQCLRTRKTNRAQFQPNNKTYNHSPLEMAG